ncbi:MAG: SdrD B-like domain-containing protein, partial [Gammaproteobacteria bacterium]
DPTRDIVGNYPLLYAVKTAALENDLSSLGIVDPGDTLRYTITVYNNGNVPATVVELFDNVPVNSTYVADTTTLDGAPIGQPDSGVFPLEGRLQIGNNGVLDPGASTTVEFVVLVDNVPSGTLITNQATVYSAEVANLLTDADGDPSNGAQPTIVVVGDVQVLSIVKDVAVVGGGAALPGATLEYSVTVQNPSNVPALYVLLRDDLDEVTPGYLAYVDQSATLNGLPGGVSVAGQVITADYFNEYGALGPGETVVLRFQAVIDPNLVEGTTMTNTARVYWDDPQQQAEASVSIDVGAMPNAGMLSGEVWHDANHDNTPGDAERGLEGWTVELWLNGQVVRSTTTDVAGYYLFANVTPNYTAGETYSLEFVAPGATSTTALLGETDSDFTDGQQRIDDIDVQEGSNLLALNMPVDPNGVVYDAISRAPVPGAVVSLLDPRNGQPVPDTCFDDPNHQNQVTIGNGYYKFDINFSSPACPGPGNYLVQVTAPGDAFVPGVSQFIPPTSDLSTLPFDVPACPGSGNDAAPGTPDHCEVTGFEFAPPPTVPARDAGTQYHLFLTLDDTRIPGTSQLFNNHIPLDPRLDGAIAVTKTTPSVNVTRGELVPYVITVSNSYGGDLPDVNIVDRFPAGFRYVEDSARFDGIPTEPVVVGRELIWPGLVLDTDGRHEIKLLLVVGAGVSEGEFVNRAFASSALTGAVMSPEAEATVRIVPDPTFDCTDVTGKVFDDANRNGYQDGDETGMPGVRLVTARGLAATTDTHGRYHITCAITPHESRGSDFVLKLDDRTLPSGYRASTRPVQVQRATRGKALRINFGASIHRVVGLDIADAVFEPGSVEMRPQWRPRINLLLMELKKAPAVLRLAYVADVESESLVNKRLDALKKQIMHDWEEHGCCYELVVEPEVFWRLGGPPDEPREVRE